MNRRHDWDAVALQIHEHLDSLERYQRPITEAAWADIAGVTWTTMRHFADRNPSSQLAVAFRRNRQLTKQWRAELTLALVTAGTGKGRFASVGRTWGLTSEQVRAFMLYNARHLVARRKLLTVADFMRFATVGMTRAELAKAMGRPARTVEDYLFHHNAGPRGAITRQLKALIEWEGSPGKALRIAAIGWELKHEP